MNITSSFVTWLRIMNIAAPSAHPKFISRLQVCFILGGHDLLGKLDYGCDHRIDFRYERLAESGVDQIKPPLH